MRDTFETLTAANGTGDLAAHWTNVARAIDDGNGIIRELGEELQNISKTTKILDLSRKQLRLNLAEDNLASLRTRVHSLRDTLQLSLQVITVTNQNSQQGTLTELCQEIRRLAKMFNETIESRHAVAQPQQDEAHIAVMIDLRECVRSAASIVSSASTAVMSQDGDNDGSTVVMSDFGDCFPVEHSLAIHRWMEASSVQGYEHGRSPAPPQSVVDVFSFNESADSSDSEVDLEDEITTTLLDDGQQKLTAGKLEDAERVLKKCSSRLSNVTWEQRGAYAAKQFSKHAEVLKYLFVIYHQQEKWPEAQTALTQKLSLEDRMHRKKDMTYMRDVVALAKILQRRGDTIHALLHARRALKGFKKLQSTNDIRLCLELLIELSSAQDVGDDPEVYSVMLSRMQVDVSVSIEDTARKAPRLDPLSTLPAVVTQDRNQEDTAGIASGDDVDHSQKLENILEGQQEDPSFRVLQQMKERDGEVLPHEIRPDIKLRPRDAKFHEVLFSDEDMQGESHDAQASGITPTDAHLEKPVEDLERPVVDLERPVEDFERPVEDLERPVEDMVEERSAMLLQNFTSAQAVEGFLAQDMADADGIVEHISSEELYEAPAYARRMSDDVRMNSSDHLADRESRPKSTLYYVTSDGRIKNKREAIMDTSDLECNRSLSVAGSTSGTSRHGEQRADQKIGTSLDDSELSTSLVDLLLNNDKPLGSASSTPTPQSWLFRDIDQIEQWDEQSRAMERYAKVDPRWWDHGRTSDATTSINDEDNLTITDDARPYATSVSDIDHSLADDDVFGHGAIMRYIPGNTRSDGHHINRRPATPFESRRSSSSSADSGFFAGNATSTASEIASPASTNMTVPSLDRESWHGSARHSERFQDQWTGSNSLYDTPSKQSRPSHLGNQRSVPTFRLFWLPDAASYEAGLTGWPTGSEQASPSRNELKESSVEPSAGVSPSASAPATCSQTRTSDKDAPSAHPTSPDSEDNFPTTIPKLSAENLAEASAEPTLVNSPPSENSSVVSVAGTDATISVEDAWVRVQDKASTTKRRIAHIALVGDGMCGKTSLMQ